MRGQGSVGNVPTGPDSALQRHSASALFPYVIASVAILAYLVLDCHRGVHQARQNDIRPTAVLCIRNCQVLGQCHDSGLRCLVGDIAIVQDLTHGLLGAINVAVDGEDFGSFAREE